MSREAIKLALEALEYIHKGANNQGPHTGISWLCVSNKAKPAITALREALAEQPAQRTWQGLTDQEIEQGCKESWVTEQAWQSAVWWAEAKLKDKNT